MKQFLKKYVFVIFAVVSCVGFADEPSEMQAKAVMGNIYDSFVKIIPYAYSSKPLDLNNKKDKEELIKNLTDLSSFFKSAKHAEFFQKPGFKPSLETIRNHLEETIISVESNNAIFAQKRLNIIGTLCVSCHTQLPESVSRNAFRDNIKKVNRDLFDSDQSYANYLYLVRRFDEAKNFFEKSIESTLNSSDKSHYQEVLISLRQIMSIDTKVKFDYGKVKTFVQKWEKDQRLSSSDRAIVKRWGSNLEKWKDVNLISLTSMSEFIHKNLAPLDIKKELLFSGEDDVTLLIASGVITNYLVKNPDTELTPELLYWLSLIEHRANKTYFYSLGDLYLKDCIQKYPKSPYAQKCYQEYYDSLVNGFSGSAGTDIPPEELKELKRLKALIKH